MSYKPETEWDIEGNFIFNLRKDYSNPIFKGPRRMRNDVAVSVEMRHLPEDVQHEIALTICSALNEHFFSDHIAETFCTREGETYLESNGK